MKLPLINIGSGIDESIIDSDSGKSYDGLGDYGVILIIGFNIQAMSL
ncbi:hypothetical protein KVK77_00815 [Helicobacter pylori]|nr:hypothetical protein [Helicobacter pylori]WQV00794.1 hypothetical protein KVK53_06445 [Helicobacter pylori]WQV02226.1 hypothetical protein KVK74_06555 [Helicobacter pylori]WQV07010.1 hypothetical protein KVK77_00815 [Helicobacter pylori]